MTVAARSYDPRAVADGLPGAFRRLEAQAALSWPGELRALRAAGLQDGMRVLDVGCGSGALTRRLAEALPSSTVIGVDPDLDLLEHARRETADLGGRVALLAGGLPTLPAAALGCDFAIARLLLQHRADPVSDVAAIRAVLAPGGLFAAIDVDGGLWGLSEPSMASAAAAHARAWAASRDRGGNRFVGRRLWQILARGGFGDVHLDLVATHSDDVGLAAFEPLLDPAELQPLVAEGVLSLSDLGLAVDAYRRFRTDPEAFVLTVVFIASGVASPPA